MPRYEIFEGIENSYKGSSSSLFFLGLFARQTSKKCIIINSPLLVSIKISIKISSKSLAELDDLS